MTDPTDVLDDLAERARAAPVGGLPARSLLESGVRRRRRRTLATKAGMAAAVLVVAGVSWATLRDPATDQTIATTPDPTPTAEPDPTAEPEATATTAPDNTDDALRPLPGDGCLAGIGAPRDASVLLGSLDHAAPEGTPEGRILACTTPAEVLSVDLAGEGASLVVRYRAGDNGCGELYSVVLNSPARVVEVRTARLLACPDVLEDREIVVAVPEQLRDDVSEALGVHVESLNTIDLTGSRIERRLDMGPSEIADSAAVLRPSAATEATIDWSSPASVHRVIGADEFDLVVVAQHGMCESLDRVRLHEDDDRLAITLAFEPIAPIASCRLGLVSSVVGIGLVEPSSVRSVTVSTTELVTTTDGLVGLSALGALARSAEMLDQTEAWPPVEQFFAEAGPRNVAVRGSFVGAEQQIREWTAVRFVVSDNLAGDPDAAAPGDEIVVMVLTGGGMAPGVVGEQLARIDDVVMFLYRPEGLFPELPDAFSVQDGIFLGIVDGTGAVRFPFAERAGWPPGPLPVDEIG